MSALSVSGAPGCADGAGELTLAERGKPSAYVIVCSEKASESERYAAEELRDFFAKMAGVWLPIATDAKPIPRKAIVVGETKLTEREPWATELLSKLGEDGFRLEVRDGRLLVFGSRVRGALYGVYEILEKYAGCRWYASWHSVIPSKKRVSVPCDLNDTQVPAFAMREPYWHDVLVHRDFATRLRVNGYNGTGARAPAKFGGDSFRFGGGLGNCHTFNKLMPPDEFFGTHPEYFSLVNGKRIKDRGQLCLTNPEVLNIVTERVMDRIRKDPGARFYGVSQNDWGNYCTCERCKAVDDEEGSHAGTMIRFVNAVAEAVEREFPDVFIETLAYRYTRQPPKKTKPRRNVVPCLCTIECDFARPLGESPCPENVAFCRDIDGWKRLVRELYVWDYTTDFSNYALPFANVLTLQGNLKFFRDNHVREIFAQGDAQGRHGDFAELKSWLLAKWMWNPDLPAEPLLQDFFGGYYGKGAPFVRQYFDELHRLQADWSAATNRPLTIYVEPELPSLDDAFLERAAGLWDKAIAATKGDRATSYNVRMGAFSVDFMRFERTKLLDLAGRGADRARQTRRAQLAKSLLERMDEAKDIRLAENQGRHDQFVSALRDAIDRKSKGAALTGIGRGEVQESHFVCYRPGKYGDFADDPKASDGRALMLYNTHYEWSGVFHLRHVGFEPGATYTVRVRARCEKASSGEAFWAGVYDPAVKKDRGRIQPKTDEIGDGYAWYDVCTWVPNESEYFWIGPGRFERGGKSAIKGLWVDKIEFVRTDSSSR